MNGFKYDLEAVIVAAKFRDLMFAVAIAIAAAST